VVQLDQASTILPMTGSKLQDVGWLIRLKVDICFD